MQKKVIEIRKRRGKPMKHIFDEFLVPTGSRSPIGKQTGKFAVATNHSSSVETYTGSGFFFVVLFVCLFVFDQMRRTFEIILSVTHVYKRESLITSESVEWHYGITFTINLTKVQNFINFLFLFEISYFMDTNFRMSTLVF